MCVDRASDRLVGAERLMLVDERSALVVVTHPRHEVAHAHAASGREVVPRMPQVSEVQPLSADGGPSPCGVALGLRDEGNARSLSGVTQLGV
jgi:hypothetical protein